MSKELEALERLKTAPSFMGGTVEYQACMQSEALLKQDYEIVKQALLKAQIEHKTLKTIKEKCVDVFRISYYIRTNRISELEWYKEDRNLTDEELELLKEVLE